MPKIEITPASWVQIFALIGKLVNYAQGGFTQKEKEELVKDLLEVCRSSADIIGEDFDAEG